MTPQASCTTGNVGAEIAEAHETVEPPADGIVKSA